MSRFLADGLFQKFRETDMPCLLVYGQNDPSLTIPSIENAAPMSQHLHRISLENSGHFPMIDETTRFNRLLIDFLAIDSGMSPRELQMKGEWRRRAC
ncbi:MAG: alpha/beta hydrolase [Chloroflexi bacterium]|nr:alpha/beta hydrolase [Chloroflexota bacterium]